MSALPAELKLKLTHRQKKAIGVVLASPTLKKGLEDAGISRSTWFSWKAKPDFYQACVVWQETCFAESLERAKLANLRAIDRITELIDHKDPRVALQACQALVPYSLRLSEVLDVKRELAEIRARLGMDQTGRKLT